LLGAPPECSAARCLSRLILSGNCIPQCGQKCFAALSGCLRNLCWIATVTLSKAWNYVYTHKLYYYSHYFTHRYSTHIRILHNTTDKKIAWSCSLLTLASFRHKKKRIYDFRSRCIQLLLFHVLNTTVWAYKLEGKDREKCVVETYLYITQLLGFTHQTQKGW